ncbi:MAG: tetratricopeptide repeat protein, partial [Desulfobulbaceae bacterium]|nr:tetratricopeptide repeat protein [Desulfobulbaceae bacterium]
MTCSSIYKQKRLLGADYATYQYIVSFLPLALLFFVMMLIGADLCFAAGTDPFDIVPSHQVEQLQQDVPEWKRSWDTARRMVLAGDYPAAEAEYATLLQLHPELEEVRWELAKVYIHRHEWQQAVSVLERLLDGDQNRRDYIVALANVMVKQKHWGRAIELFTRIVEKSPGDIVAVEGMAKCLLALDRQKDALPYLERAYRHVPDN